MKKFGFKIFKIILGLFLCSMSIVLNINADIGMAPWDLFHTGIAMRTGFTIGQVTIAFSFVVLAIDIFWLKIKVGLSTILNITLIGIFVDLINYLGFIPVQSGIFSYIQIILGLFCFAFGFSLYVNEGYGAGARDSLLIGLCKKFNKPTKVIKTIIEVTVFILGVLLGGKFGIGTLICVFIVGPIMQLVYKIMKFDLSKVEHVYIDEMYRNFKNKDVESESNL